MTEIPPLVLLDPTINMSLGDVMNKFKETPLIGVTSVKHSSNYLFFLALVSNGDDVYHLMKFKAEAVIKYKGGIGQISLIYLTNIKFSVLKEFNFN